MKIILKTTTGFKNIYPHLLIRMGGGVDNPYSISH